MTEPGFKRLWRAPRCVWGSGLFYPASARQRYLREQSFARYRRRPDVYPAGQEQLRGELGTVENFRFITTTPSGGDDWFYRAYLERTKPAPYVVVGVDWAPDSPVTALPINQPGLHWANQQGIGMQDNQQVQAVDVVRDKDGYWCHPAVPEDGDGAALRAWFDAHQLEVHVDQLEYEGPDHPAYVEYFDNDGGVSAWEPAAPPGPGWFTLAIYDSEDGPQWLWARRKPDAEASAAAA